MSNDPKPDDTHREDPSKDNPEPRREITCTCEDGIGTCPTCEQPTLQIAELIAA